MRRSLFSATGSQLRSGRSAAQSSDVDWNFINRYWIDPESGFVWKSLQAATPEVAAARNHRVSQGRVTSQASGSFAVPLCLPQRRQTTVSSSSWSRSDAFELPPEAAAATPAATAAAARAPPTIAPVLTPPTAVPEAAVPAAPPPEGAPLAPPPCGLRIDDGRCHRQSQCRHKSDHCATHNRPPK